MTLASPAESQRHYFFTTLIQHSFINKAE